jgi:hypothetical protein
MAGDQTCTLCGGTGFCKDCGGRGGTGGWPDLPPGVPMPAGVSPTFIPCPSCLRTGLCPACNTIQPQNDPLR